MPATRSGPSARQLHDQHLGLARAARGRGGRRLRRRHGGDPHVPGATDDRRRRRRLALVGRRPPRTGATPARTGGRTAPGRRRNSRSSGDALLGPFSPRRSGRTADASTRLQLPDGRGSRRDARPRCSRTRTIRTGSGGTRSRPPAMAPRSFVPTSRRKSQSAAQVLSQERSAFERSLRDHRVRAGRRCPSRCVRGWDRNAGERRAPRRPRLSAGSLRRTRRAHDRGGDRRRRRPRARSRPRQVADRGVPRRGAAARSGRR